MQLLALALGGLILVINFLFPPWVVRLEVSNVGTQELSRSYRFLFTPPEPVFDSTMITVAIDWAMVFIQAGVIVVVAGLFYILLGITRRLRQSLPERRRGSERS